MFVSWLPLYHDMGLIGAWLGCCYFGARLYVMSPISFLVRPATWLWTMHKYRATFSGGPNFAFELAASRIPDADLEGLDLSALRFVVNGAEPISPATLRRFTERFAKYGMNRGVPSPSYGLAENCVGLCFPPFGRGPQIDRIKRESLARRGYAEPADENDHGRDRDRRLRPSDPQQRGTHRRRRRARGRRASRGHAGIPRPVGHQGLFPATRRRRASSSTTAGSRAATAPTSRTATSTSPGA